MRCATRSHIIARMQVARPIVLLGLIATAAAATAEPVEREANLWPISVQRQEPASRTEQWSGAGPFLFRTTTPGAEGATSEGFRPFWVRVERTDAVASDRYVLYPLFRYSTNESNYQWSLFELVRRWGRHKGEPAPTSDFERRQEFEVFPFWFSREAGDPALSYQAFFPFYGTVKNKLGFERLSWTVFPFYVENERKGAITTSTPWPFIRVTRGAAQGWGFWPFYEHVERPGVSRSTTYLWPLGYDITREPAADAPPGTEPRRDIAALPFYVRSSGPGFRSKVFAWPFFGYTDRTEPKPYHERRYFWPFFVQGRGDGLYINRWAPFYTHSIRKGYDKQWVAWPLLRYAEWADENVERRRTQLLYFLYWNEEQRRAGARNSQPASLTHLWPLFSHWDNGAGRVQWQALSPLDVFFPGNRAVRLTWSPLFALARHEQTAPGQKRTSLLWNAITWESSQVEEHSEFHLGPLFGISRRSGERRVTFGRGLFGLHRSGSGSWRPFWLDFSPSPATSGSGAR